MGVEGDAGEDRAYVETNVETVRVQVGPITEVFRRGGVRAVGVGNKSINVVGDLKVW